MESLVSPFGEGFGFAIKKMGNLANSPLYPEEMDLLSPRAVAKRRHEFYLGRAAAHAALRQLEFYDFPVMRNEHNEPVWPEGIVGSITHCRDIAVAAVARRDRSSGIGIDAEEANRSISFDIARMVCTPQEMEWVQEGDKIQRLLMLFSAKESVFKAFFPLEKVFLDFRDAQLVWENAQGGFQGRLLKKAAQHCPAGYTFQVGCLCSGQYIFTYLALPPL